MELPTRKKFGVNWSEKKCSENLHGKFEKGDHILVKDINNIECARGLTSFSSNEIEKIKGLHSSKIKNILGYSSREEIVHKDDLVEI